MSKIQKQKFISRVYMYIFLSLSFLTGLGIVQTYAYADLELCVHTPELFANSVYVNAVSYYK